MHAPNYMEVVDITSKFRPSGIVAIFNIQNKFYLQVLILCCNLTHLNGRHVAIIEYK
jgi:hypothetical protein